MIESAQATLGGIKENSQSSKVPKQNWGAWRKIQNIWASKNNNNWYDDARPSEEWRERAQARQ
jgi:hypothetical protein